MARKPPGGGKPGSVNPQASKDGFKLPAATRKSYKPPKAKKVYCGARKRNGGKCTMLAGWGTNHPGIGKCKMHAGATPTGIKGAAKEAAILMGQPKEINAVDALIWCIKIKAGEVEWLTSKMAELEEKDWIEDTMVGKQFNIHARQRQQAMNELARFSQMAISLNIAERAVKMAETYGEMLAAYTKGILDDLWKYLSDEGKRESHTIVRKHLILLDGGRQAPVDTAVKQIEAA